MAELIRLEKHLTFAGASARARALATQHNVQTGVRSIQTGWEVLVPPHLIDSAQTATAGRQGSESSYADYDADDETSLIIQELEGDREDWARSDEEGWFYGDDN